MEGLVPYAFFLDFSALLQLKSFVAHRAVLVDLAITVPGKSAA